MWREITRTWNQQRRKPSGRPAASRGGRGRLGIEPLEARRLLAVNATVGVTYSDPSQIADGYTLFSPSRGLETYLIDREGAVVNSWQSTTTPGLTGYLHTDGSLYRGGRAAAIEPRMAAPGVGGLIEKYDWEGNLVWRWEYSDAFQVTHHDMEVLPNGNVLLMVWDYRSGSESIAAGRNPNKLPQGFLIPDSIIEVQQTGPTTGDIVWRWDVWDHLVQDYDSSKANFGSVSAHPELINLNFVATGPGAGAVPSDWTHANGIDYNAELDQIMISVREFSEFWVIDHSTTTAEAAGSTGGNAGMGGDLLYRWGNPRTYRGGTRSDQRLFYQHDAEWIDDGLPGAGNVLVFNNGTDRRDGSNYSSVDEVAIPVLADGTYDWDAAPSDALARITGTPRNSFYAPITSGQVRLDNGNTLVSTGPRGVITEVNPQNEIVWEYVNPVVAPNSILAQGQTPGPFNVLNIPGVRSNLLFKAEHYAPDYAALVGRDLTPGQRVEIYPESPVIQIGNLDVTPISGNEDEEYIELVNANSVTVDLSGWTLSGAVDFEFPVGTILPPQSTLYAVADQAAFAQRATGPGGGQSLLIVGDYSGDLDAAGETIVLTNDNNEVNSSKTYGRTNTAPQVAAIANLQVVAGRSTDPIAINVTDPDTDPSELAYLVIAESLPYVLDQQLQLDAPALAPGDLPYHINYRGQGEKYLIHNAGVHPFDKWYYLLPDGSLYRYTGDVNSPSPSTLRGEWIANLGPAVYADPRLLHGAVSASAPVTFAFSGNVPNEITVTPSDQFIGTVPVTVTVIDGDRTAYVSFQVESVDSNNLSPTISSLVDVTGVGVTSVNQPVQIVDPDDGPEPLFLSTQVVDLNYGLDQLYTLEAPSVFSGFLPFYQNYRGSNEKYLINPNGTDPTRWFYILPNGQLFQFTGDVISPDPSTLTGIYVGFVGAAVYDDPALLYNASNPSTPITASLDGVPVESVLVEAPAGFSGSALVTVIANDGEDAVSESFQARFVGAPTAPPVLSPIADQQVIAGQTIQIPLVVSDDDTDLLDLQFDASIGSDPDLLAILGRVRAPVVASYSAPYYQNYRGSQERYVFDHDQQQWYYLLPSGDFFRFTGNVSSSSPTSLVGDFLINVGSQGYADPSQLSNVTPPEVVQFSGSPVDTLVIETSNQFSGMIDVEVVVSDGANSASQTFSLTVNPIGLTAPHIDPIADQAVVPGGTTSVAVGISDPDTPTDQLVVTTRVESLAGVLNESLALTKPSTGTFPAYYRNFRGAQEKYLLNPAGLNPNRWYYLLPNGDLYRFTGNVLSSSPSSLKGDLLAKLGSAVYANPALLHEASRTLSGLTADFDEINSEIDLDSAPTFSQQALVTVGVSDGNSLSEADFIVSPAAPTVLAASLLATIDDQPSPPALSSAVALSIFGDPDVVARIPQSALDRVDPRDVNGDRQITAVDAVQVINFLSQSAPIDRPNRLQDSILSGGSIYDANLDGNVTAVDALLVINRLAQTPSSPEQLSLPAWQHDVDKLFGSSETDAEENPVASGLF